jgi:GMP synthase (glutamine-hydrolysing)
MDLKEITLRKLNAAAFIEEQVAALRAEVGDGLAVNALSGGVDSSTVTLLGHKALGKRLKSFFINNALMREGEPDLVVRTFRELGVPVELVDARIQFIKALKGVTDPEEKREAITQTFYREVFGRLVKKSGAKFLLQGTIYTDVEETVAGVKRQHNVLAQLGIDTQKQFGYQVLEPLIQLRKPAVRVVARALGLPKAISERPPFPGPALAARVIGEATAERLEIARQANCIVEEETAGSKAFQCFAILHDDRVTGVRNGRREFGLQIEVRCWDSKDATTATPTRLPWAKLRRLADRLTSEVKGVVSATYNIASKPPSTMEAV